MFTYYGAFPHEFFFDGMTPWDPIFHVCKDIDSGEGFAEHVSQALLSVAGTPVFSSCLPCSIFLRQHAPCFPGNR